MNIFKRFSRRIATALCALLAALTLLDAAAPVAYAAVPPLRQGIYVFYAINKQMCLNSIYALGDDCEIGTDGFNGQTNEMWILEHVGTTGYVTLRPMHAKDCYLTGGDQGEVLTLQAGIPNSRYAHWKPIVVGDHNEIVLENRMTRLVVDCTNGHIGPESCGNRYISWERNGYAEAQSLYPVCLSTSTTQLTSAKRVSPAQTTGSLVVSADQSMAVNAGLKKGVGAKVILDGLSSPAETNEVLTWIPRGNNLYSLHFSHAPDACIAPSDIFQESPIVLKKFNANDPFCLWEIYQTDGTNGYSFRNAGNFLMMDNLYARTGVANPQISCYYNGDSAQIYYMKKSSSASSITSVIATNTSVSSAENTILQRLNDMMNGNYGNGTYEVDTKYQGKWAHEQCKGFAKDVFQSLFGYNIGSTKSKPNNYQISISSSKTSSVGSLTSLPGKNDYTLRNLFDKARAGDFIQIRRWHGGSHSAIFVSSNSNGVTLYECNVDGKNGIIKKTYSWSQFRSDNNVVTVYTAKNYYLH